MEFIKVGDKYLIKGSNGIIVDEKERLELEQRGLIIKDITSDGCQKEVQAKLKKNKKRLAEIGTIEETK